MSREEEMRRGGEEEEEQKKRLSCEVVVQLATGRWACEVRERNVGVGVDVEPRRGGMPNGQVLKRSGPGPIVPSLFPFPPSWPAWPSAPRFLPSFWPMASRPCHGRVPIGKPCQHALHVPPCLCICRRLSTRQNTYKTACGWTNNDSIRASKVPPNLPTMTLFSCPVSSLVLTAFPPSVLAM